jgi:ABC-2 type transport system ATP-binding protein
MIVDLAEPDPPLVVEGAEVVRVAGPRQWLRFRSDGELTAARLLSRVSEQVAVRDLTIEETAIDDVVRRIYAGCASECEDPP